MDNIQETAFERAMREFDEQDRQSHGGGEFNADKVKEIYKRSGRLK